MIANNSIQKFELGQIVATPGAIEALKEAGQNPHGLLNRHCTGDWGIVCQEDKDANDASLIDGSRIMSAYLLASNEKIWVITEAADDNGKRSSTTFLLPSEY